MHMKQRCQSSRFLSRQGSTAFGGQNIENPLEIKVPKISSQDSVEAVKNVRHERTSEGSVNRFWLSKCPRPDVRTECCSVQSSRLSTSLVSRVNEYNNVLPNLINKSKLDALFTKQRAFEDHIASLEREAEYTESVAEKEWLGLMPLLRSRLSEIKEQLALALKRASAPCCRSSGSERFSCCLTLSRMWSITR